MQNMSLADFELMQIQKYIRDTFHQSRDQFPDIPDCMFEFTIERFMYTLSQYQSDSRTAAVSKNKFLSRQTIRKVLYASLEGTDPTHSCSRILDLCFPHSTGILMPAGYNPAYFPQGRGTAVKEAPRSLDCDGLSTRFKSICAVSEYGEANITEIAAAVEMEQPRTVRTRSVSRESWASAVEEVWHDAELGIEAANVTFTLNSREDMCLLEREWAMVGGGVGIGVALDKALKWFHEFSTIDREFQIGDKNSALTEFLNGERVNLFPSFVGLLVCPTESQNSNDYFPICFSDFKSKVKSWTLDKTIEAPLEGTESATSASVADVKRFLHCLKYFESENFVPSVDMQIIEGFAKDLLKFGFSLSESKVITDAFSTSPTETSPARLIQLDEVAPGDAEYFCQVATSSLQKLFTGEVACIQISASDGEMGEESLLTICKRIPWKPCVVFISNDCNFNHHHILEQCPNAVIMTLRPVHSRLSNQNHSWTPKNVRISSLGSTNRKIILSENAPPQLLPKLLKSTTNWSRASTVAIFHHIHTSSTLSTLTPFLLQHPNPFFETLAQYLHCVEPTCHTFRVLDKVTILVNRPGWSEVVAAVRTGVKECVSRLRRRETSGGSGFDVVVNLSVGILIQGGEEKVSIFRREAMAVCERLEEVGVGVLEGVEEMEQGGCGGGGWESIRGACGELGQLIGASSGIRNNVMGCVECLRLNELEDVLKRMGGVDDVAVLKGAISNVLSGTHEHVDLAEFDIRHKEIQKDDLMVVLLHSCLGIATGWIEVLSCASGACVEVRENGAYS
ncbi:hypothetical protein HDU98_010506 [Podochytrium sp. JEL0797]|nr:hypothetical protein HDU98_010506 [Podochytrium sp. JEL0797]